MGSYFSISISAVENSIDADNNISNITVTLYCNGSNGFADDNPAYWLKVNDTIMSSGTRNFSYENFVVATWTGNVPHEADGTGAVTFQGYFQGTDKPNGDTTSVETLELTPIPQEDPTPSPEPESHPQGMEIPFFADFERIIPFVMPDPVVINFSL